MSHVLLQKVCVSENQKEICMYQGTGMCGKCGVNSGQRFHSPEKLPVLFKGKNMSELVRTLLFGQ